MWLTSTWSVAKDIAAGRLPPDTEPMTGIEDLVDACQVLQTVPGVPADTASLLAYHVGAFAQTCKFAVQLLEQAWAKDVSGLLDAPMPPGLRDVGVLEELGRRALAHDAHLLAWYELGAILGELQTRGGMYRGESLPKHAGRLQQALSRVNAGNDYAFLSDLQQLASRPPRPEDADLWGQLKSVSSTRLDAGRVGDYLAALLREGVRPEPWIVLRPDSLHLFSQTISVRTFGGPKRHALLWLLAERPDEWVGRQTLRQRAGLACSEQALETSMTRLRDALRPFVNAYFAGSAPRPAAADSGFIVGSKLKQHRGGAPYKLAISPILVVLNGHPPAWVRPSVS